MTKKNNGFNWRIDLILLFIVFMFCALGIMISSGSEPVAGGKADLSRVDFTRNESVRLNGQWEFYWNKLLVPEDFANPHAPQMDTFIKVPGSWHDEKVGSRNYPDQGVATYRVNLKYPSSLKDPALRIQNVSSSFKLFANGQLIKEVGKVSNEASVFKTGYSQLIVNLPNDGQELELLVQVADLNYARGGLLESPLFGSKQVLEYQRKTLLGLQLLFIGSVFVFAIYYLLIFLLTRENKTAIFFSMLCFITGLHSSLMGETPLLLLFSGMPITDAVRLLYFTSYNLVPMMILFVLSIYPHEYKKLTIGLLLLPNLLFEVLLLAPIDFMSSKNLYIIIIQLLQMIYTMGILGKAVLRRRDNAALMLLVIGIFVLMIVSDMFSNIGLGIFSYMTLFGNFTVIIAMSYIQARQQADTHKKLILYNEKLLEADRLKDEIMTMEMSFWQAQIKPHFLYNTLDAIANICEKDGGKAAELILDLAIYLRISLEFNQLDKMTTIEKELEFVDTYFNIEQARFGQKIQLVKEIAIPLDHQIPTLILQPLVENAVRHGISKKPEGGTVYLRIKKTEEEIFLDIEDDGMGIDHEKLAGLLSGKIKDQGVGLMNIHHRLLRLYGHGLTISSETGRGTRVRLVVSERDKPKVIQVYDVQ